MESRVLEQTVQDLCARDIAAFPVVHAGVGEGVASVKARMRHNDFSHMPLRNAKGRVVSVLHRDAAAPTPLDRKTHVVKAEETLSSVVKKLPSAGFLLVKSRESGQPDQIAGIINHADVLSLPVRMLIYTRTMQLEDRVFKKIAGNGTSWGKVAQLARIWERAELRARRAREQRSSPEAYLPFRDLMTIGKVLRIIHLSDDEELGRLCAARNFASHAAIDFRPETIPAKVEQYVNLVEHLW